jgi:zinc transporter ZupT
VLALLLRRNLVTGKNKIFILILSCSLLTYTVIENILGHGEEFGLHEILVSIIVGGITLYILASFQNHHHHTSEEDGIKGIVISEAFHSLIDGAVIGATYLVNPIVGGAATMGIVIHELPKIIGTLTLFKAITNSTKKTMMYGVLAQGGAPISAVFIYLLGKEVDHEKFHTLEVASIASLATIILWIIFLELQHHMHHKKHEH